MIVLAAMTAMVELNIPDIFANAGLDASLPAEEISHQVVCCASNCPSYISPLQQIFFFFFF
jgi:hypothetical protein